MSTILFCAASALCLGWQSGNSPDKQVHNMLKSTSVIDKWLSHSHNIKKQNTKTESPLLKQAKRFALLLNPPRSKTKIKYKRNTNKLSNTMSRPAAIKTGPVKATANFTLLATSCYPANPAKSLALINEPGKGIHWVRTNTKLGYLKIKRINRGSIEYSNGKKHYTIHQTKPVKTDDNTEIPVLSSDTNARYAKNIPVKKNRIKPKGMFVKKSKFHRLGPGR